VNSIHPFLDHPSPIPFAHRGGTDEGPSGGAPENTLPAFQDAIDLGYQYLETDVHASSDGVLFAFHDSTLDRMTDTSGAIEDMTYADLRAVRVRGSVPIPVFEDLLSTFPDARINIDPKLDSSVGPLTSMLKRLDCLDRVCIGAFSDKRLLHIREELGDAACLGLGPRSTAKLVAASRGVRVRSFPGQVAQVPPMRGPVTIVDPKLIAGAHRAGIAVHVWTINERDEMQRMIDLGVDGIMTDRTALLKEVLEERDLWVS